MRRRTSCSQMVCTLYSGGIAIGIVCTLSSGGTIHILFLRLSIVLLRLSPGSASVHSIVLQTWSFVRFIRDR